MDDDAPRDDSTDLRPRLAAAVSTLAIPASVLAIALAVAPHLRVSEGVAGAIVFLGAALVAMVGIALGARVSLAAREVVAIDAAAVAVLLTHALLRSTSPWMCISVDLALIAAASATGAFVGSRVQDAGHLLPAGVVAACLDVASVVSPSGPTHALAESERAMSVLAVSFPVPGTHAIAPALGVGDLVFIALFLGAARAHALPQLRVAVLAFVGVLTAGIFAALLEAPVPALPSIALFILAFVPRARTLRRKDRTVATIAIGAALAIAAVTVAMRLLSRA